MSSALIDWWWPVRHPHKRRQRLWSFVASSLTEHQTCCVCTSLFRARDARLDTAAYIYAELRRFGCKYRVVGRTFYWPLDDAGLSARLEACRERGAR